MIKHWAERLEYIRLKAIARAIASTYHNDVDALGTRAIPMYITGNLRLIEDEKSIAPIWAFFLQEAQMVLNMEKENANS